MEKSSTFYIVTPSYNQGVFIAQTLHSILDQTGVKVVSLVRDGGSSDQTVAILKNFGSRIKWVSQTDNGQSEAINQGLADAIRLSTNPAQDYFAYLNSDDYYLPGALAKVADYFDKHPEKNWLVGECEIIDNKGKSIQPLVKWYKRFWRMVLSWSVLLVLNPIPQPAVIMRLSAAKECGAFNEELQFVMDYHYWLRLWQRYGAPGLVTDTVAAFRIHHQSKSGTQFLKQFAEELVVARQFTKQPLLVFCHEVHNTLITVLYSLIK